MPVARLAINRVVARQRRPGTSASSRPVPAPHQPPYRRRRLVALGGLLAAVVAIVLAVVSALGSGSISDEPAASRDTAPAAPSAARTTTATTPAPAGPSRDMGEPGPPRPVPILMYHVISDPPPGAPYPDLYVTADEFADQMEALKAAGYTAVTLQELWDGWQDGGPLPRRPVVLTFDDGYRSHMVNALPVLQRLGWPGVLFLELKNLKPDWGLREAQVRKLIAAGWEIDSHTIDHPDLTTIDAARLEREVGESRRQLRAKFGVPVNFFCYPAGRYDETVIAAVERAGYLAATTVNPGLAQPDEAGRFELDRVRVNNGVAGAALVSQLEGLGS